MKKERKTRQKEILIEYLEKNTNQHFSIQEIYSKLRNQIGITTIYRIINSLIEIGKVSKIPFENKQGYCYKYNSKNKNCSKHYHLICEKCNELFHFESKQIAKLDEEIKNNEDFNINNDRIVFYGVCKLCNKNRSV